MFLPPMTVRAECPFQLQAAHTQDFSSRTGTSSNLHQRVWKRKCPGAGGLVASLKATKGAGTLKAAKGLARLQDQPRVEDERIVKPVVPNLSIFRSESKQISMNIESSVTLISKERRYAAQAFAIALSRCCSVKPRGYLMVPTQRNRERRPFHQRDD